MKLPIGSVKGNVGHTLECAGIAGMLKVLLALKHGVIPPQPNLRELNPEIPWNDVPFYVPTQPQPWPSPNEAGVRRAAVNAFGIGGLNAHFVIDDRPEPSRKAQSTASVKPAEIQVRSGNSLQEPVAVIGMGAIVPNAKNVEEFWQL